MAERKIKRRWRVLRGLNLRDGRRIEVGSYVERLDDDEANMLEAKDAIQPMSEPAAAPAGSSVEVVGEGADDQEAGD